MDQETKDQIERQIQHLIERIEWDLNNSKIFIACALREAGKGHEGCFADNITAAIRDLIHAKGLNSAIMFLRELRGDEGY